MSAPAHSAHFCPTACPVQRCVPNGALCTKCWVTVIQSAAKARALTDEKPELSNTALRKKQKLNDPNITEKPDGIKMTLQAVHVLGSRAVENFIPGYDYEIEI